MTRNSPKQREHQSPYLLSTYGRRPFSVNPGRTKARDVLSGLLKIWYASYTLYEFPNDIKFIYSLWSIWRHWSFKCGAVKLPYWSAGFSYCSFQSVARDPKISFENNSLIELGRQTARALLDRCFSESLFLSAMTYTRPFHGEKWRRNNPRSLFFSLSVYMDSTSLSTWVEGRNRRQVRRRKIYRWSCCCCCCHRTVVYTSKSTERIQTDVDAAFAIVRRRIMCGSSVDNNEWQHFSGTLSSYGFPLYFRIILFTWPPRRRAVTPHKTLDWVGLDLFFCTRGRRGRGPKES